MNLGKILKYYRSLHNMTQSDVASLSGINEKYLGRIERGESIPTIEKVEQLCMAFDVRLSDMFINVTDVKTVENESSSDVKLKKKYYCNCCGCLFEDEEKEVICPNCLCREDSGESYIDKYIIAE